MFILAEYDVSYNNVKNSSESIGREPMKALVESHDLLDDVTQNFVHSVTHSRTQSPSYARCDEGLWPNP